VNGFIDHLRAGLGIISSYSATTNLYNSQITTEPTKPFPACYVFISHSLVMVSNNGDSPASHTQVLSSQSPTQKSQLGLYPLLITSQHEPHRKHSSSIVVSVSVTTGTCLWSCFPEMAMARTTENTILLLLRAYMLQALPSNDCCLQSLLSNWSIGHNIIIQIQKYYETHSE
jgi:hypothetical protein